MGVTIHPRSHAPRGTARQRRSASRPPADDRTGSARAASVRTRALPRPRRGLTVYEVFLALTLLLGSLAVLSQHVTVGTRAGVRARLQTQASLLAETKLAEVLGGVEPMSASSAAIADAGAGWNWSLEVAAGPQEDLLDLTVTVTHANTAGEQDASFALRRLVRDPQVFLDAANATSTPPTGSGPENSTP